MTPLRNLGRPVLSLAAPSSASLHLHPTTSTIMKHLPAFIHCLSLALFATLSLHAKLPEHSVILEAEAMAFSEPAWKLRPDVSGWYTGKPSGGAQLNGYSRHQGTATGILKPQQTGQARLWVRYLDLRKALRKYSGFIVTLKQNGKTIATKTFDEPDKSLRRTKEGQRKWGTGFAPFVWDCLDFQLPSTNDLTVELKKLSAVEQTGAGGRHVDVFLLTHDRTYEPVINDLYPWFVRIRILPEQKDPIAIHLFGKRSNSTPSWFTRHINFNKKGMFIGPNYGAGDMLDAHFKANDVSQWFELNKDLSYHGSDSLSFTAIVSYYKRRPKEANFELQFANAPSEDAIRATYARRGKGYGISVLINAFKNTITSEVVESQKDLDRAIQGSQSMKGGKAPRKFPFATGLSVQPKFAMPSTVEREIKVMELLGINTLSADTTDKVESFPFCSAGSFFFHRKKNNCLQQPKHEAIREQMAENVRKLNACRKGRKIPFFNLMDEPGSAHDHVSKCPFCKSHFQDYLKTQKVSLEGLPSCKPEDGLRYYWSMRYRNYIMTEMLRTGTKAVLEVMPNAPTMVNFATELVFDGNMVSRGCDWFEILGSGALNYGWGEDWANLCKTYQVANFYDSALRAACRPRNLNFGMYDILGGRSEWEIQTKGYTHIGNGANCIYFFSYGPLYATSTDTNNTRPEIYPAIAKLTHTTGAVEDWLLGAKPAQGDAAQLLSVTSDIWNQRRGNVFGKERIYLNLLLRHCNYRLDVISEQEIATTLNRYKLLFVSDSHLLQEQLPHLIDWIKAGGTLYLGPGALQFNEADKPLGFDQQIGLTREAFQLKQKPGRADYEMSSAKPLDTYQGMKVTCAVQKPFQQSLDLGKGKVIYVGFFPGISYIGNAKRPKDADYSMLDYPAAHRQFIANLNLPVKPSLRTDNHRVEAHLLNGDKNQIIVLSNWSGAPADVTLTLDTRTEATLKTSPGVTLLKQHTSADALTLTVRVEAGGYILRFFN